MSSYDEIAARLELIRQAIAEVQKQIAEEDDRVLKHPSLRRSAKP
jgi:hypothetical protein